MATRLTKKQKEALTDKITGLIKSGPALRMTTDSSVNEMNINQISGELNRIHNRAIGKEFPTIINIPYYDNGYIIDGVGTIYGGELNLDTMILTSTLDRFQITAEDITGVSTASTGIRYCPLISVFRNMTGTLNIYLEGYIPTQAVPESGRYVRAVSNRFYVYDNRFIDIEATANILVGLYIAAEMATHETYTLTPQQMLQLLDQL